MIVYHDLIESIRDPCGRADAPGLAAGSVTSPRRRQITVRWRVLDERSQYFVGDRSPCGTGGKSLVSPPSRLSKSTCRLLLKKDRCNCASQPFLFFVLVVRCERGETTLRQSARRWSASRPRSRAFASSSSTETGRRRRSTSTSSRPLKNLR